jgi:hypothetical protein
MSQRMLGLSSLVGPGFRPLSGEASVWLIPSFLEKSPLAVCTGLSSLLIVFSGCHLPYLNGVRMIPVDFVLVKVKREECF